MVKANLIGDNDYDFEKFNSVWLDDTRTDYAVGDLQHDKNTLMRPRDTQEHAEQRMDSMTTTQLSHEAVALDATYLDYSRACNCCPLRGRRGVE
jgi:hypothetical protein